MACRHWALFVALLLAVTVCCIQAASKPCVLRSYPDGQVCVCNATYCDTLDEPLLPASKYDVVVVSSGPSGTPFDVSHKKFTKFLNKTIEYNGANNVVNGTITINEKTLFQTIIGFGGAHTGAVTYLLQQLPQSLQDHIFESYYSPTKGIGYTMTRVPIGGSDFDLEAWVYNELPANDKHLTNFTKLDQRDLDRIKQFYRQEKITGVKNIKYMGSAWSSPNWMKPNPEWFGPSHLLPEYYEAWADYHIRYLQFMQNEGIDFWAITTGNEPLNGNVFSPSVKILSLGWDAEQQAKWVGDYLGPKLQASNVSNVQILAGDDQRYTFPSWFQEMERTNSKALDYLGGFAVHFYFDSITSPSVLDDTKHQFPSKFIINTESCVGVGAFGSNGPNLGSWSRAQTYILSYIQDLQHYVSGWIDWNLLLDTIGGPNYALNYVDAPIITNASSEEIYKQPMFYAIGHFSRFITEGSIRVDITSSNDMVKVVGFKRPDGNIVLVQYNQYIQPVQLTVVVATRQVVLTIPALTVQTVVYQSL